MPRTIFPAVTGPGFISVTDRTGLEFFVCSLFSCVDARDVVPEETQTLKG